VSRAESAYILGETKAADIRTDQKGRCETDYGSVQFPFMPIETQARLLKDHIKPMTAKCAYLKPQIIKDYLGGKSTEELYSLKKLSDLVQSIESVDSEIVVQILHKTMKHKIESVNSKVDPDGISHIVTMPNGVKLAVMIRVGDKIKISAKHITKLKQAMARFGCSRGIVYTSAIDLNQSSYKLAIEGKIELVDHEDMLRLAHQIEAGMVTAANFNPSELADRTKESGEFQKEHEKINPQTPHNVVPLKPIIEELLIHNGEVEKKLIPKLKRIPVRLSFLPRKEDTLTVVVHAQRTKNNEIFRVLFYTLSPDNSVKHKYYVDRKLTGVLDEETAIALDVPSIKDWNAQAETFNDNAFETKILEFFNNFKTCQLPAATVTWEENSEWLSSILKREPHMVDVPTKFEDCIEASFGEDLTKEQLIQTLQVKPEKVDMFFPAEIDLKIWSFLS
jgi:hypothetical protein